MPLHLPSALSRALTLSALVGLTAAATLQPRDGRAEAPGNPSAAAAVEDEHAHHHHAMHQAARRVTARYEIPDVTLVDQSGQPVRLRALLDVGEPVLLNFIFTTCTAICPVMSGTFSQVQKNLGADAARLRMVSISIDPEHDTPAELKLYAERFNAGPQWSFLTGSPDDVIAVQRAFDAYRGDKMNHAPLTLMRASPLAQWVRIDGLASGAELSKESHGMVGS